MISLLWSPACSTAGRTFFISHHNLFLIILLMTDMSESPNAKIYTGSMADHFDEVALWSAPFGLKLLELVDYKTNLHALDLGCGTGFPLFELAMRLGPTSKVTGLDPWKEAIAIVKKKIAYYKLSNVSIIEGVGESIPLESNSLDLIVSNNGINNVSDISLTLSECARVLHQHGQLILTMNLDTTMKEFYDVYEKVLHDHSMQAEIKILHDHIYHKRRPVPEIATLLEDNGFVIRNLVYDQFTYQFTDGDAMFHHYFIRIAFLEAWRKIVPVEKVDLIFNEITARLNEVAKKHGRLTLTVPFVVIDSRKK
jgi:ubiquinone/menaquinone biosynthesis C-methylase UbiE